MKKLFLFFLFYAFITCFNHTKEYSNTIKIVENGIKLYLNPKSF